LNVALDQAKILEQRKVSSALLDQKEGDNDNHQQEQDPDDCMEKLKQVHSDHEYVYYVHFVECKTSSF
jgi:hypothetical protein